MVWNSRVEVFDAVPHPLIAVGNAYPQGHATKPHYHRRHQLLHGSNGAVMVSTLHGNWVIPPQRGMWIPAGTLHEVRMLGEVSLHSLYLEPGALLNMPPRCQVVGISPFLRGLIREAMDLPAAYERDSRAAALMTLIGHELQQMPALPLGLKLPAHAQLSALCRAFLLNPTPHTTIDEWANALGLSRRGFTRLVRQELAMSFSAWRQQACLFAALPRLAAGMSVTAVALELGYDNPAAFTAMFKRCLGHAPRDYLRQVG